MKYERERHVAISSAAEYWVKIPDISSSADTDFYIYYGKSDASDGADAANVWDSNFKGVWHKNNRTTTSVGDSTSNAYHGTKKGVNEPAETAGKIGLAQNYDGTDDFVNAGNQSGLNFGTGNFTVSMWVKPSGLGIANARYMSKNMVGSDAGIGYAIWGGNTDASMGFGNGTARKMVPFQTRAENTWRLLTGVRNGSGVYAYTDGVFSSSDTFSGDTTNSDDFMIGAAAGSFYFKGMIDIVTVSNMARSVSWIKAMYHSGNNTLLNYVDEGFISTGTYKSPAIDTASKIVVSSISWNSSTQPAGTNLVVGIRVSSYPFSINSSTPSWLDVSNGQTLNWHGRYIQYQSTFTTTNSTTTPRLEDISITYRVKPWQEKSVTRTPPNSFGFGGGENWVWKIPVKGGQLVTISAYIRYNTEYQGASYDKPKLTLSGLGINESISATSSAENSWELRQLSGTPSSDGILTLKAEGFSPNPGGKFYIDDINVSQ